MVSNSFLLFLVFNLFHSSQILLPIHDEFLGVGLTNTSCMVDVHQWHLSSQEAIPLSSQIHNATLACSGALQFFSYTGQLHFAVDVVDSKMVLVDEFPRKMVEGEKQPLAVRGLGEERLTKETTMAECNVNVNITDLSVFPPDPFLALLSSTLVNLLNAHIEEAVCELAIPVFQDLLKGADPLIPVLPPEEILSKETIPLPDSELFVSVVNLVHALPPPVPGAHVTASFIGNTSLRLSLELGEGIAATYHSGDEKRWRVIKILISAAMKHLPSFLSPIHLLTHNTDTAPSPLLVFPRPWSEDTTVDLVSHASLPPNTTVSLDVNLKGFEWDPETYTCNFARDGGVTLSNFRVAHAGSLGGVLTNFVLPVLSERLNKVIAGVVQLLPTPEDQSARVTVPLQKPDVRLFPPLPLGIAYGAVSLLITVAVVERGRRQHRAAPIQCSITLEEISLCRVVVEDLVLSLGVCFCFGCFVWSNSTTAATLVLGEQLKVYSFSLRSTVMDLWSAGLSPLSFAVALFSGVYPYVKLAGVLYYTAIKHTPNAPMLHAMDYVGKLSLLDTFVMLMMVTGLTIKGVADVEVYHPFYIFLVGTVGSIAMGNYATRIWRRNTTLRTVADDNDRWDGEEVSSSVHGVTSDADPIVEDFQDEREHFEAEEPLEDVPTMAERLRGFYDKGKQWIEDLLSYPYRLSRQRCGLMLAASLPAWFCPLVSYRVGGVGPLLTNSYKTFTLFQLSAAVDPVCLIVTFFTVLVAPCLYVMDPKRLRWLASWCAADALVLACLAGLVQLNDFVEFIVGEDLVGIYTAHAVLHLSLLPLFLGALYVWWLVLSDLFHLKGPADAWIRLRERFSKHSSSETEALLAVESTETQDEAPPSSV